ncbi:MAG TPA: GatB/YqeY domain-containing protein [Polyangiaceae bacterium]|nr:GatB/YqeY domain-containing protein [Polyangiaceae bacterium]
MSLADEIKKRMFAAMKAGRTTEKEILRVAMGEITTAAGRSDGPLPDEEVQRLLKKLVKSNREALATTEDAGQRQELETEIEVLSELLPRALGVDEICAALEAVRSAITAAPQPGPAVGIAMKHLKQSGLAADAATVNEAVARLRA